MANCVEELTSQHYRGRFWGFGAVTDSETVLMAIFENTKCRDGRILSDAWKSSNLKTRNESLARSDIITKNTFIKKVGLPSFDTKGKLIGLSAASVADLRKIRATYTVNNQKTLMPGFCVLDRVEDGDYSAHATLGYANAPGGIGETSLGKIRSLLRIDLAAKFGKMVTMSEYAWPGFMAVQGRRLRYICVTALSR